jgi:hypothetical protein
MKHSKQSSVVVSVLFAILLPPSIGTPNARDADLASQTFAAAQTTKQKCINSCRARYRDCQSRKQIPFNECRVSTRTAPDTLVLVRDRDDRRAYCRRQLLSTGDQEVSAVRS